MKCHILLAVFVAGSTAACKTLDPVTPAPDIQWRERVVETPCIISVAQLPELDLPEWPPAKLREEDPVAWASEVRRVSKLREECYKNYIEAYRKKIEEHNRLEPKCE